MVYHKMLNYLVRTLGAGWEEIHVASGYQVRLHGRRVWNEELMGHVAMFLFSRSWGKTEVLRVC